MKFVDDLLEGRAEAATAPGREDAKPSAASSSLSAEQLAEVEPALEAFYGYLDEFCQVLAKKSPNISVGYDIRGATSLKNLTQGDYALVPLETVVPKFRFSMLCLSKGSATMSVATEHELSDWKEYLNTHQLRHRVESQSEMRFVIRVEGFVPVSFVFEPHPTEARLRIHARNLDRLGVSNYSIEPKRVNRELMDEFGKRVLRMDNQFDRMTGFEVSDAVRAKLQKRVAARQAVRAALASDQDNPAAMPGAAAPASTKPEKKPLATVSKLGALFKRKARSEAPEPDKPKAQAAAAEPKKPATPPKPKVGEEEGAPTYAWVVTRHDSSMDTNVTIGKLGPLGASKHYRVNQVLMEGRAFQMRDQSGELAYSGYLAGNATGMEPLNDYGRSHGCVSIEYEKDGKWLPLQA